MSNEKSYEELKAENEKLKKLLSKKLPEINAAVNELMEEYYKIIGKEDVSSTVSDSDDVKSLLKKYSQL
ncbi:MAG: hypothetical protein K2K01_04045 [Eubacterium sp.]|nr:hypothetical protein [Eubacterium sp.]